jgi:plastocyanin
MKTFNSKTTGLLVAIALGSLLVIGCGSKSKSTNPVVPPTHSSHFHDISIANFAFTPSALTIPAGDTVLWTNNQNVTHTVTSDTGTELSQTLSSGATYQHIFAAAGSFPYHCAIHTTMHGSVTVQ